MSGKVRPALALAAVLALAPGCRIEDVDLSGRPCPCVEGWICDLARDRCVRDLEDDGGARDAVPSDAEVRDAPPGGDVPAPRDANADEPAVPLDAAPEASADATVLPGPNVIANPGCEGGTVGWDTFQASLTTSATAHGGSSSCQVCIEDGYTDYTMDDNPNTLFSPRQGEVYTGRAWVRAVPGATGTQTVQLVLREWPDVHDNTGAHEYGTPVTIDQTWRELVTTHTMEIDAYALDFYLLNDSAAAGDCFLADDLVLQRVE